MKKIHIVIVKNTLVLLGIDNTDILLLKHKVIQCLTSKKL